MGEMKADNFVNARKGEVKVSCASSVNNSFVLLFIILHHALHKRPSSCGSQ